MPSVRQRRSNIQVLHAFTFSTAFPLCKRPSRPHYLPPSSSSSLNLERPKPIQDYLRAYGVPENFIHQLSSSYMNRAMELYNSVIIKYDQLFASLPTLPGRTSDPATPYVAKTWMAHYEDELSKWKEQCLGLGLHHSECQKLGKRQPTSSRFNEVSARFLKAYFKVFYYPSTADRQALARMTGNSPKQIADWFQNNRNRTSKRIGKKLSRPKVPLSFDEVLSVLRETLEPVIFEGLHHKADSIAPEVCPSPISTDSDDKAISELHASVYNAAPHAFPCKFPPPSLYQPFPIHPRFPEPCWPRQATHIPKSHRHDSSTVDVLTNEFLVKCNIRGSSTKRKRCASSTPPRMPSWTAATSTSTVPLSAPLSSFVPTLGHVTPRAGSVALDSPSPRQTIATSRCTSVSSSLSNRSRASAGEDSEPRDHDSERPHKFRCISLKSHCTPSSCFPPTPTQENIFPQPNALFEPESQHTLHLTKPYNHYTRNISRSFLDYAHRQIPFGPSLVSIASQVC